MITRPTLSAGDTGPEVQKLQSILAMVTIGHDILVADGKFGFATGAAVIDFQRSAKLAADGIVGKNTWAALDLALAKKSDSWLHTLALKLRKIFGVLPTGFEKFEWDNSGPHDDEHPLVPMATIIQLNQGQFVNGWYSEASKWPSNPGRIGPAITPKSVVVHTTDCAPGTMATLLINTQKNRGDGGGYHFLIGKSPQANANDISGGIYQLVPITRNGNHAGGRPTHGWFKTKAGALIHPNTCTVGIELDNAGRLKKINGKWIHVDSGRQILDSMVHVDVKGRGWEKVTAYQMAALHAVLRALDVVMPNFEEGVTVVPNGTYKDNGVSPEAALPGVRFVGHWTLDPTRKNDPGPQVTEYLRTLVPGYM